MGQVSNPDALRKREHPIPHVLYLGYLTAANNAEYSFRQDRNAVETVFNNKAVKTRPQKFKTGTAGGNR
jgi:hypothetical protein